MEVLENATIVKNLSDPTSLGNVWSMANGLIGTVEFTEYERRMAVEHPDTIFDITQDDSFDNWCRLWDSFEKQWKEDLEYLNLDDLDFWLVNESNDIAELSFKLNKVKCRVGELWDLGKASQLHTNLLNLTDRLAEIILTLKRNAYMCMYDLEEMENFAGHRAWGMIQHVCKWVRDIIEIQKRVQKIIRGAENILNPQPDTTTEQEQTVKLHSSLLDDEEIKEVFNAFVEKGYMVLVGNYYHWKKSSHLLAYFCEKVSLYFLNSTKTYDGKDATEWKQFEGLFEIEIKGKLEYPNNDRLRAYKNNWYRGKDRKTTPFLPNGYNGVEDILADLH